MKEKDLSRQIKKAQTGDTEAFSEIYDVYSKKLFRYIRVKVQNQQQAEDVLQEVFVKIWRGLPTYDESKGSFNSWAYRIAGNALNDFFRKIYRSPEPSEISEETEYSVAFLQSEAKPMEKALDTDFALTRLRSVLDEIPELYKQVLEYRFMQDLEIDEIGEILGKSNLAVRLLQHRAIKKLKEASKKRYERD